MLRHYLASFYLLFLINHDTISYTNTTQDTFFNRLHKYVIVILLSFVNATLTYISTQETFY